MVRVSILLTILISQIANTQAGEIAPKLSEVVLTELDARSFVQFNIFKELTQTQKIDKCIEYTSRVGEGFDMETTVTWSCKLSVNSKNIPNLISSSQYPLRSEYVGNNTSTVCPDNDEFNPHIAYVSSESLADWDINDIAIYVNTKYSELLVCYKVLIVP